MSEAVKSIQNAESKISTGADLREEMALIVGPNANWEDFLVVAPMCISLLGELICISTTADFSLEKKPPKDGFKLLRWPHSFRASLVQVANSGWEAFNEAHTSMDQIRLLTANVPGKLKEAVTILIKGDDTELEDLLPIPLNAIQSTADQCLSLAESVEAKYVFVMQLTAELLEACVSAKSEYEQELKETEIALEVARENKKAAEEQKEMAKKATEDLEKAVKKAEKSYDQAMDSMPNGWEVLGMNVIEDVGKSFTTAMDGFVNSYTFGASSRGPRMSTGQMNQGGHAEHTEPQPSAAVKDKGAVAVYTQAIEIQGCADRLTSACVEDGVTLKKSLREELREVLYAKTQLDNILHEIRSETVKKPNIKDRAVELCTNGIGICDEIKTLAKDWEVDNQEEKKLTEQILNFQENAICFATEGRTVLGSSPTDIKPPLQRTMRSNEGSGSGSSSQMAVQNARFKIEQASASLEFTREKYETACNKMMDTSKKLGNIMAEMAKLDIKQLDFEKIKQTLIRGIRTLGQLREEWAKLVMFFSMMSNIIRCSLNTSLKDFLKYADTTQSSKLKGYPITSLKRDMIYQQAFQGAKIAYVVNMISGAYVEVSKQYVMDRIAGLGKLLGYDPGTQANEIAEERKKLFQGMKDAQLGIANLVKNRKSEFDRQIAARVNKIRSQLEQALPEDSSSAKTKEIAQRAVNRAIENVKESKSDVQTAGLDLDSFV